jgi:hypothetical protein
MSASIQYDPATQLCELHIGGILKRAEYVSCESELAGHITAGGHPRMLVICENFGGWERGEDWQSLDFMFTYGAQIAKIAIVGAGTKEAELKAFTGAGLRPTPVKFFQAEQVADARAWLA